MDWYRIASFVVGGGLLVYYLWPLITKYAGLVTLPQSTPSRLDAAEHLIAAEEIATELGCVKSAACCRQAAQALFEGPAKDA